jgi:hypothetical protein
MKALRLVMMNNIFIFGDTFWKQLTGTAMGTPPAPPWATLYYALHEQRFVPRYTANLLLYKRFIDDVFGIWRTDGSAASLAAWERFKRDMNSEVYRLKWDISDLSQSVDFMDLTISIRGDKLHTTLFEKVHNLHLYIPPHSCHPPGLLTGMVHGILHRIYNLCSDDADKRAKTRQFFHHLQCRGYPASTLRPMFNKAIARLTTAHGTSEPTDDQRRKLRRCLFFHLRYHPQNPKSHAIQHAWRTHIAEPQYSRPLAQVKNYAKAPLGIDRLIVAYSRPLNLGNILSYRKLKDTDGPPVSSFLND